MANFRSLFSIADDVHYLNCAYMSPMPNAVALAGMKGLLRKAEPYNISQADFFSDVEKVRYAFANLIRSSEPQRVAIIPSVSYAIATVAKNLPCSAGEEIIVAHEQFPSNIYSWQMLARERQLTIKTIAPPETLHNRGALWNEAILKAITDKTALVALPHFHWADGTRFELAAIADKVHRCGGVLVVDGTQSIGAYSFDLREIRADAVIAASYKWLMGPYSIGVAWYGPIFDNGQPIEESWMGRLNSEDFSRLIDYQPAYQPGAIRYDVGEKSNFILIPMLLEALRLVQGWGTAQIQSHCRQLTAPLIDLLTEAGCYTEDLHWRSEHLLGVRFPKDIDMARLREELNRRHVLVSYRGDAMRVSPHLYNTPADIEALMEGLQVVLKS
ncbi:aminotransferase class V-fold PLP-dependent enzyme [Rhodoflexus sp.]